MGLSLVHTFLPASSPPQTIVWPFPLSPLPHQISSTSSSQSPPSNYSWLLRCILVRGSSPSDILRLPVVPPFLVYRSRRHTPRVCLKHDRGIHRHFHPNDQSPPPPPHPSLVPVSAQPSSSLSSSSKNVPRRSTIQRTSSKMHHARLICTTRSVRTRDLTNWVATLRYASFGNIAPPWGHTHNNANEMPPPPSPDEECERQAGTIFAMYTIVVRRIARCSTSSSLSSSRRRQGRASSASRLPTRADARGRAANTAMAGRRVEMPRRHGRRAMPPRR